MIPIILDTQTGLTYEYTSELPVRWWIEGNGSCDCNRSIICNVTTVDEDIQCKYERFLIIDVLGDLEVYTKKEIIELCNGEYPAELVEKYIK